MAADAIRTASVNRPRGRLIGSHYAGRQGDGEFAVQTITSPAGDDREFCRRPCRQCPWRSDVPTGVFPAEAFRHSARTAYDMAQTTFACHTSGTDKPRTCAGFLLRGADHSLAVRLSMVQRRYDPREVEDGGFPLYESYRAMAEANGVAPDDPALGPCR